MAVKNGKYSDPILLKIIEVLERDGPEELIGRYGTSDPGVINKGELSKPMVFVTFEHQDVEDYAAGELQSTMPVLINVVCDMTRDFGQGLNASAHMKATGLAIGRDPVTFAISDNSIVGALRKNQQLAPNLSIDIGAVTKVEPDAVNRSKGLVTSEMLIRTTITHEQLTPELA